MLDDFEAVLENDTVPIELIVLKTPLRDEFFETNRSIITL